MATINLGAIKFNWKGAYEGGTTYAVDDVVSSGGSSYVCILASTGNATSNGTYWEQMSSAGTNGTNGTDIGTTITTQGDILYRDGSGLQRLGAGTSGQFLKTSGTGANPVWGDAGGGVLQIKRNEYSATASFNSSSGYAQWGTLQVAITPTANNSSFWLNAITYNSGSNHDVTVKFNISDSQVGATTPVFTDQTFGNATNVGGTSYAGVGSFSSSSVTNPYFLHHRTFGGMYTPSSNNGNARTFKVIAKNSNDGTIRPNMTLDSGRGAGGVSTLEVWEIANGIYI